MNKNVALLINRLISRQWVNFNNVALNSRSVTHPAVPVCKNFVRVQEYVSNTVMHPHTTTYEVIHQCIV